MGTVLLSVVRKIASAFSVVVLSAAATQASAAEIVYLHTGLTGSGTLNGQAFNNASFAIQAFGDTDTVVECGVGCFQNINLGATITIDGIGLLTFNTPTSYIVTESGVSFARADGVELFSGPAISGWDLKSAVGPLGGDAELIQWGLSAVQTSGGVLVFNDGPTGSGFSALVSEVPVPAGIWLFGSGLVGLVGIARRKA